MLSQEERDLLRRVRHRLSEEHRVTRLSASRHSGLTRKLRGFDTLRDYEGIRAAEGWKIARGNAKFIFCAMKVASRVAHPDPRMDALQRAVMEIVETASSAEWAPERTFVAIQEAAWTATGAGDPAPFTLSPVPAEPVPRLTEPWFC